MARSGLASCLGHAADTERDNRPLPAMVARITTVAFAGVEVLDIDVQVQMGNGLPAFTVVGLPDKAVAESRERVRAALAALGLALPPRRITVKDRKSTRLNSSH